MTERTNHPVTAEEMMSYLDGELPVERAAAAAAHLEVCAECQALAGDLRAVSQRLAAWQVEPSPAGLEERVRAAFEQEQQARQAKLEGRRSWFGWLSGAPRRTVFALASAAVLACVVVSLPVFHRLSERRAAPAAQRMALKAIPGGGETSDVLVEQNRVAARSAAPPPSSPQAFVANNSEAPGGGGGTLGSLPAGPMIARQAELSLVSKDFDSARGAMERILRTHRGYIAQLNVSAQPGAGRVLTASLRVPANELDATLSELKKLGRVEQESQSGEEVTEQYVDLSARLANAQNTEQRLLEVLQQRTGKMADVLAVEREIDRVRGEIERMQAEKKNLETRVQFAAVELKLTEEYKATLEVTPPSTASQLRNAAVEGYRSTVDSLLAAASFLLAYGPAVLLWCAVLFWPARWLWRRARTIPAR